jgi:hypothetical protein
LAITLQEYGALTNDPFASSRPIWCNVASMMPHDEPFSPDNEISHPTSSIRELVKRKITCRSGHHGTSSKQDQDGHARQFSPAVGCKGGSDHIAATSQSK